MINSLIQGLMTRDKTDTDERIAESPALFIPPSPPPPPQTPPADTPPPPTPVFERKKLDAKADQLIRRDSQLKRSLSVLGSFLY